METPPQFYRIRDLVLLPELNPREQLCEETISRYMESFDALPPVSIQEGTGVLVDGFHRVEAAARLGAEAIPVRMLDIPDEELHLYAGLANCGHGRALSRPERNRFIVRLVEQYEWPADKVARSLGVSPSSVSLALREHRYNQVLSERLGEAVQVINSAHVQALYRVGAEQRAQLLDAVAGKTDEEGRPRPLTGAELKTLVDRLEDPQTSADELHRLLSDPLARPEPPLRRPGRSNEKHADMRLQEVERRGPLSGAAAADPLRAELLERALSPKDEIGPASSLRLERDEMDAAWEATARTGASHPEISPEEGEIEWAWKETSGPAPLGLDRIKPHAAGAIVERAAAATLDRCEDEPGLTDLLREAERLLCDLCARMEDAELWDELRSVRDLVREAAAIAGG
jgi:ParB-like chromosome segregation protein Spo0J